ncbi:MAG TPA: hypothetical protein VFG10_02920 [Saprospiraceae bacterium]|nr:hypothetical protein [Saprospiraceae bacterium]
MEYELTQNNPVTEQTFMSVKAEMYIGENFVLLLPFSKSSIISFGKSYLPMVFTHDLQSVRLRTNHGNVA